MSDLNGHAVGPPLDPNEILRRGNTALDNRLALLRKEEEKRRRLDAVDTSLSGLWDLWDSWRGFTTRHKPGTEPCEDIDRFQTKFLECLNSVGADLRSLEAENHDWHKRWPRVDHESNFDFWFCSPSGLGSDGADREQQWAAYQYAVYLVGLVLDGRLTCDALRPALDEQGVRGAVTHMVGLLRGVWGLNPLREKAVERPTPLLADESLDQGTMTLGQEMFAHNDVLAGTNTTTCHSVMALGEQHVERKSIAKSGETEKSEGGSKPTNYKSYGAFFPLKGWPAIIAALNEQLDTAKHTDNEQTRTLIRKLNTQHRGPIVLPTRRGTHPQVDKFVLLEWWGRLREHFVDRDEEAEQETESKDHTVADTHPYSSTGTVVPEISGHIKSRKKTK
jgi:hypothetical protein